VQAGHIAKFANSGLNGNESYDFIFVDFSNGTDYIQRNSLLLQEVIRRVNQVKAPIGTKLYKNVVVGASMGGLVARHALASMEKQGENHCTHTYVSFDSPQKGANIPLSIQAMGWFFGATSDDPALKSNWDKLSTPAPRKSFSPKILRGVSQT
jgi:PGAP1-like protein